MIEPGGTDEAALARQAQAGSAAAFGALVAIYHHRVFGFLMTLTRHRQDAEDLTQDTFVRAWRKFHHYNPDMPLLPWLLTLARRLSISAHRKVREIPADIIISDAPRPEHSAQWLWGVAKTELSADAYSALWLHYREELSLKEVAEILGKREGAVKVILHRARHALSTRLRAQPSEEALEYFQPLHQSLP